MSQFASIEPEALLRESTWLQALAEGIVHDEHAAEDVVQATFLRALTHPPRSAGALRAWLGQVTRRFAYRTGDRARWGRRREEAAARAEAEPSAAELVTRASLHRAVVDAVLALDEPQRATVLMRFFENLPPREIAKRHGIPVATVRSRLRRALDRLRETLDQTAGGREAWMSGLGITTAPLAVAGAGTAGTATATTVLAAKAKIAAAAAIVLVAAVLGWRWIRPAESKTTQRTAGGRSEPGLVAARPQDSAARDRGPAASRIVPRRVAEQDDGSRAESARLVGKAVDEDTGDPLAGAEVSMSNATDPGATIRTVTQANGAFALPRSSYWDPRVDRLTISARDHVRWEEPSQNLRTRAESRMSGRDIDFGTIRIERGAAVTGRVVAAKDRRPVAGALLFLRKGYGTPSPPHTDTTAIGTSAEDGTFTLPERQPATQGTPAWIIAVHPAGVDWALAYVVKGREAVSTEILAREGVSISVRVIDSDRRPLPDAIVLAIPRFPPFGGTSFQRQWVPPRPDLPAQDSSVASLAARFLRTTDAAGSVEFSALPEGRIEPVMDREVRNAIGVFVFKDGLEPATFEAQPPYSKEPVTVVLTPSRQRSVSGVVRNGDGDPIADAMVGLDVGRATKTNGAGEYRISDGLPVAAEAVQITARAPGFAFAQSEVRFAPGQPESHADFRLLAAAPIFGRIVDETGRGIGQASVSAWREGAGSVLSLPSDQGGRTRDDGAFSFSMADGGIWKLDVAPQDWQNWEVPRARSVQGGETVEITVRRAATARARVVAEIVDAATGALLDPAGAYLGAAHPISGDRGYRALDVALGSITATQVPPGDWRLIAGALGYARGNAEFSVGPSDETVRVRLALGRPGAVVARVILDAIPSERRPNRIAIWAPDARWVTDPGKPAPSATRGFGEASESNGWTCRFEDVAPNVPLRFWLEPTAGCTDEQLLTIASGETRTIELRPRAAGTATLSTSKPVVGEVVVRVSDDGIAWHGVASSVLDRAAVWSREITRASGAFRWRVELWPLDVPPRLRVSKIVEGVATIEAGKTTAITVQLPE